MPQCGSRGAPDDGGEGQSSENELLHGTKPNTTSWLISSIVRSCGDCGAVMAQITAVTVRTAKTNIVMRFSSASSLPCFADRRRLQRTEARRCEALRTTRRYLSPAGPGDGATRPLDRLLSPRASAGAGTGPPIAKGGEPAGGGRGRIVRAVRREEPITAGQRCRSAGERRRGGRLARITPVDVSAALAVLGARSHPGSIFVVLRGGTCRSASPSSSRESWRPRSNSAGYSRRSLAPCRRGSALGPSLAGSSCR